VPVSPHIYPSSTSPTLASSQAIQVAAHSANLSQDPAIWAEEVIALPTLPERTNTAPLPLDIAPEDAQSVFVHTNTFVRTPRAANSAMVVVVVVETLHALPEPARDIPAASIPLAANSLTIAMATDALERTPREHWLAIIMVVLPHLPILTLNAPTALHITFHNTVSVSVQTNALVRAPFLASPAVECMVVMVAFGNLPVRFTSTPVGTIPVLLNSLTIFMSANALV